MTRRPVTCNLLILMAVGTFFVSEGVASEVATFHVSPDGKDSWSGRQSKPDANRTDGPRATLAAACAAARQLGTEASRRIVLQAGEYFFDEPVVLTEKDNGLTIEAATGADVTLYGGRKVAGWHKDGPNFYAAALPGVREGDWDFRALIVNGRYCPRARLPKEGRFEHRSVFDVRWMSTTGGGWQRKPTDEELTTLKYRPEDLGPWLDIRNAEVTVYHMWDDSMVGVLAIDTESHTLTFTSPTGHPAGAFGVKTYVVWNVREGMTEPGQWYLDRTAGKVVYWPLPGEDMSEAEVIAPVVESIVRVQGSQGKPVRNVTLRGLRLAATTTPLMAGGFGAGRFDGALSVSGAENCTFGDLEILHVGGQGIKAAGNDLRIRRCHVHHVGACGIRFSGARIEVVDNHVHDVGLTYPSAIALQGGGRDSLVAHNHVHHAPYSAINYGGQNTRIEANRIHDAMLELHDGGGIYCFAGKDLVLRGNYIYDIIDTGGYGASAYYLDERSEGCLVEGNLSVNVVRPSHNHMAKGNTIRNNVFINEGDLRLTWPKSSDYRFEKNVLWATGRIVFENREGIATLAGNVLHSVAGQVECRKLDQYSQTGEYPMQADAVNILADPKLIAYRDGQVQIAPDSPAHALDIEPIDVSGAGPRP
ncbi:right-handed parallel beta-helix repeat-containing protein [Anaerobaca lacustris]|uniref:Right-handed parallel beta-helix repeat-containing protein n=1 Tax=Anaerobaca lacustris TaxID=3044600 RepID=A0AAW6TV82_9BACT|nr:right-handed parallel beta-helix repeat-containing protein [Sedimentisphaerales bacterium M17dextr]